MTVRVENDFQLLTQKPSNVGPRRDSFFYFVADETKYLYNPTVGATFELTPAIQLGAEYWVRGRFDSASGDMAGAADSPSGAQHYAGPTVLLQGGEYWLAVGAYIRLDGLGRCPCHVNTPINGKPRD